MKTNISLVTGLGRRAATFGLTFQNHLVQGDRARDSRDWAAAAKHYEAHLQTRPNDQPVWKQLGHAFKESGDLDHAIEAYDRSLRLDERDPDALLSLGHAFKLKNDMRRAVFYYRRSFEQDGNNFAAFELDAARGAPIGFEPSSGTPDKAVLEAINTISQGLSCITSSGVTYDEFDNVVNLVNEDPWILIQLEERKSGRTPVGLLTIEFPNNEQHGTMNGRIYFNYGHNIDERYAASYQFNGKRLNFFLALPAQLVNFRWDPDDKPNQISIPSIRYSDVPDFDYMRNLIEVGTVFVPDEPIALYVGKELFDKGSRVSRPARECTMLLCARQHPSDIYYKAWIDRYDSIDNDDRSKIKSLVDSFSIKPKFSFVLPVFNTPPTLLRECIDSLLCQSYRNFEICISDDKSTDIEVIDIITGYATRDKRVKFAKRHRNGHISAASNSALELADGDFIVLIDHDDLIPSYALAIVAFYINKYPSGDIFYSDEDKIDINGRRYDPYFKSEFNKFLMYAHNMISHLGVYRRSLVLEVGGFRLGLEGAQDYDLYLRCFEHSSDDRVIHIPHILYHWRAIPGSTAISAHQKTYAAVAAQSAINGHFERTGMPFRSVETFSDGVSTVIPSRAFQTLVSIIIPTKNGLNLLKPCIDSILDDGDEYREIIIVDNQSNDLETLHYLDQIEHSGAARIIRYDHSFNFSLINNYAAQFAKGEILCFLNNDTEILEPNWLVRARAFLSMPDVGAVGARLLYPSGALQHFGVVLGIGDHGVAGHAHVGYNGSDPGYFGKARLIQECSAVTAACMFVPKRIFAEVGGFEPELVVAYNDVDLCLKIRALGLRIVADPGILLVHKESQTRGSDKEKESRARLDSEAAWMHARWSAVLTSDPYYSPNLSLAGSDFKLASPPRVSFPWRQPE